MRRFAIPAILLLLVTAACEKEESSFENVEPVTAPKNAGTNAAPAQGSPMAANVPTGHPPVAAGQQVPKPATVKFGSPAEYGKTGPLRWEAPNGWQASQPGSSMRLAEYIVPGQPEPGVLSIFYFGAAGGGGVEANISRWVGQFDGGKATPKRGEETVNGMKVHTVDVSGSFNAGMAGGGAPAKDGQRMLGAIAESPAGLFFFKLVGPKEAVAAAEGDWKSFVGSFQPGS